MGLHCKEKGPLNEQKRRPIHVLRGFNLVCGFDEGLHPLMSQKNCQAKSHQRTLHQFLVSLEWTHHFLRHPKTVGTHDRRPAAPPCWAALGLPGRCPGMRGTWPAVHPSTPSLPRSSRVAPSVSAAAGAALSPARSGTQRTSAHRPQVKEAFLAFRT